MRYWFYDESTKRVKGPHLAEFLTKQAGFGPETLVAPHGAGGGQDWKRARDVDELKALLPAPPAPPGGRKKG